MAKKSKWTKEILENAVIDAKSISGVLRNLGLSVNGGNFRLIKGRISAFNIKTDHMTGQGWLRGKTADLSDHLHNLRHNNRVPDGEVFKTNSLFTSSNKLRKRAIDAGIKYVCAIESCPAHKMSDWCGKPINYQLDHINGIHNDNRLENLRFLCSNCHFQTDTWGRKQGSARRAEARCNNCGGLKTRRARACKHCAPALRSIIKQSRHQTVINYRGSCNDCGTAIKSSRKRCGVCNSKFRKTQTRITWPTPAELGLLLETKSVLAVAKLLGVTDNAVRKHCTKLGLCFRKRNKMLTGCDDKQV